MKIVWRLKTVTVRDVYEALLENRKVAYTSVMTMMNILERKKYLKKSDAERAFVYEAAKPQKQVVGAMVQEFVDRVFNGAARPLLLHLVDDKRLSSRDIKEIAKIMRKSR